MPTYPRTRMRRMRSDDFIRRLAAENALAAADFVWPIFVHENAPDENEDIAAMPGVQRWGLNRLPEAAARACELNILAVAVFPAVNADKKTAQGEEAHNPEGIVPRAVAALKRAAPQLGVMVDAALDPYTTHGHDGVLNEAGDVDNDETVRALAKQSLCAARAGADVIAPSDMMDGRVRAVRDALEGEKFFNVKILSYAAKYCSAFYGPFRHAVGSAKSLSGGKQTYQMNPANRREARAEIALDLEEGADMVMIKPAMPYLDIIRDTAAWCSAPVLAYQVSGEYAMIRAAAAAGAMDEQQAAVESLLSIKRAGARAVFSYFAPQVCRFLQGGRWEG